MFFFFVLFCFSCASQAFAATYYWVGDTNGDSTNVSSNWTTSNPTSCATSGGGAIPTSSDTIRFDADCDTNATVDAAFSVDYFYIDNGYSGTVTQAATITTAREFSMYGTFVGGSQSITVGTQFTLQSGANFTSTSGTLSVGTSLTLNNATFTHNNGTVLMTSTNNGSITRTVGAALTFNTFTIDKSGISVSFPSNVTTTFDGAFTVTAAGSLTSGNPEPTLYFKGNVTITSLTSLYLSYVFNGTGTQNYTDSASKITSRLVTINKASGSVVLQNNTTFGNTTTVTAGTLDLNGMTITTGNNISVGASGTLQASGTETISGSPTASADGATFKLAGSTNATVDADFFNEMTNDDSEEPHLVVAGGATTVFTVPAATAIDDCDNVTITSGILSLNGNNLTPGGANRVLSISNSGTLRQQGGETVTFTTYDTDSGTWQYVGDGDAATDSYNLKDVAVSATSTDYYNLDITSTDPRDTFVGIGTMIIGGTLNIGAGTYQPRNSTAWRTVVTGVTTVGAGTYLPQTAQQLFKGGLTVSGGRFTSHASSNIGIGTASTVGAGTFMVSSGVVVAPGAGGTLKLYSDFNQSGGTFTHSSGTVTLDGPDQTIYGNSTTFYSLNKTMPSSTQRTLTFEEYNGTAANEITFAAGGTLTMQGHSGSSTKLLIRSSVDTSQARINPLGTVTVDYVDVKDNYNNSGTTITPTNSSSSGNNFDWAFPLVFAGTVYTDEGVTNIGAGIKVALSINGAAVGGGDGVDFEDTDASGNFSLSTAGLSDGDVLTFFLDDEAAYAVTVTKTDASTDVTGLNLYQNYLIVRSDKAAASITNVNLETANDSGDVDINQIYTTDGSNAVTLPAGVELFINSGDTYVPGATVTVGTGGIDINGTFTMGANAVSAGGSWDATGGAFTTTGTVTLTGNGASTVDIISDGDSFYDLDLSDSGAGTTFELEDALDVNNNLTITGGTLDTKSGENNSIAVGNNFSNASAFTARSGTVTFDATDSGNTFNPGGSSFYGITFNGSGGVWSLDTNALTVTNALTITAGTFDLNGVNLDATGATFSNTNNGTLRLQGGETVVLASDSDTGTVVYYGTGGPYVELAAGDAYKNLTFNGSGGVWTLDANLDVNGALTITDGTLDLGGFNLDNTTGSFSNSNNGTLRLQGGETITALTMDTDSGTVVYNGTGAYTDLEAGDAYYNLTFNGSGGSWTMDAALDVNGDLTITDGTLATGGNNITLAGSWSKAGTFTHGNGTVTLDGAGGTTQTIVGDTTFYNLTATATTARTLAFTDGSTQTIPSGGALTLTGSSGQLLTLVSTTDTANWNLNFNGATQTVQYADIDWSNSGAIQMRACASTDGGNNTNWSISGGACAAGADITGTAYSDEGVTPLTGVNVSLSINGAAIVGSDTTDGSGVFGITNQSVADGDVITAYLDTGGVEAAVTVTLAAGAGNITGLNIYQDRLIATHENAGPLTNANLQTANNNGDTDIDAIYTIDGSDIVTMPAGKELFIKASKTYTPGAAVTVGTGGIDINGTFTMGANAVSAGGAWDATGGAFTSSGIVTLTGNGASTVDVISDGDSFNDLVFNDGFAGTTFELEDALDVNNDLTITAGTLDTKTGENNSIAVGNNFTNAGTFTARDGTVTFDATDSGNTFNPGVSSFYGLTFNGSGGVWSLDTNNLTVTNALTITAGTFDLNALNLTATGATFSNTNNGTLRLQGGEAVTDLTMDTDSGTVVYNGGASYTDLEVGDAYNNLTFNGAGDWTLDAALDVNGNFTITDGTVVTGGNNITVAGSWSNADIFTHGSALVTFDGTATGKTITSGGQPFYNLTINGSGGEWTLADALTVDNAFTLTAGTLDVDNTNNYRIIANSWTQTGGTFQERSGAVILKPSANVNLTPLATAAGNFYNLQVGGLVGYWKLDETAANSCTGGTNDSCDSSGYKRDGAWAGNATASATIPTLGFPNTRSVTFDGTGDYISFSDVGLPSGSSARSITAWVKTTEDGGMNGKYIVAYGTIAGGQGYLFGVYSGGRLVFTQVGSAIDSGATVINDDVWHHVAVTDNGVDTEKVYVDGIERGSGYLSPTTVLNGVGYIGISDQGNDAISGEIDDVRIYDRALTAVEVAALAAGTQPASSAYTTTLEDTLDVTNDFILAAGTLDTKSSESNAISVAGNWYNYGGVLAPRAGTVTLDGTASGKYLQSGGQRFNNLTVNGSGGAWNLNGNLGVGTTMADGTLTITTGTVDADSTGNYNIHTRKWTQSGGTFTPRSGTVVLDSAVNQTFTPSSAFYNLRIEDATESGLVGYWKFDEGNTNVKDHSGNNYHGTMTNGPVWSATKPSASQILFDNIYSMKFDGTDDYVETADISQMDSASALTLTAWIKRSAVSATVYLGKADDANNRVSLNVAGDGNIYFVLANGANTYGAVANDDTDWHHLALVFDGSQGSDATRLKGYIDGVAQSLTITGPIEATTANMTANFRIGEELGVYTSGYIDDVRIYSRALSSTEVGLLYAGKYADGDNSTSTQTLAANLDVNNHFSVDAGVLAGSTRTINVAGDWNNYSGSSGFSSSGTVTLDGAGGSTQNVRGSNNFNNLTATAAATRTLKFENAKTQAVAGTLTLTGSSGQLLVLDPITGGSAWNLNVSGSESVDYVNVEYSDASAGITITACNSTDGGNNTDWTISGGACGGGPATVDTIFFGMDF